jgi:hypothetical protein
MRGQHIAWRVDGPRSGCFPKARARERASVVRRVGSLLRRGRLRGPGSRSRPGERRPRDEAAIYDAFISYSHAVDGKLAPALQSGLHRFAKSWYRLQALRVFRDETSLSANPALWYSIVHALDRSRWFELLASPEAARSKWVNQEVEHWCANKRAANVLVVVTRDDRPGDFDWERTTAVPPVLQSALEREPRTVDLRWAREVHDVSLQNARFRDAVADVAAPLHDRPNDELHGEEGLLRIVGELRGLGVTVSATSVRAILARHGLPPAPERDDRSWRDFLRQHQRRRSLATSSLLRRHG